MRPLVIGIAIVAFGALLIGGLTITSGSPFQGTVQVTNAEASAVAATNSQLGQLGVVIVVVVLSLLGISGGLATLFWLLNRGAIRAAAAPPNPFEFSLSPEGNTIGSFARQNPVSVIVALSLGLVVAFLALALLTGAL